MADTLTPTTRYGGFLLLPILALLSAFGPLSIDTYLPSLPMIGRTLTAGAAAVQLTLSAFVFGFAIGQIVYGPVSDRYGRRPLLILGLSVYIVTSALAALSTSIEMLIALRFVQALGGGAGTVIARAVIRDKFEGVRGAKAMSHLMLLAGMAPLVAPLAGGFILQWLGWRAIFWFLAAFGVVVLGTVILGLSESNPAERRIAGHPLTIFQNYGAVLRNRVAMAWLVSSGVAFGGLFAHLSGTPFVYIQYFGVSPRVFGLLLALKVSGFMVGTFINGKLVGRVGVRPMLIVGNVCAAVSGLGVLFSAISGFGGLWGIVMPLYFYLASLGLIGVNSLTLASANFPTRAGSVAALFGTLQFGVGAFIGVGVGQWHNGTPVPMASFIAGCGVVSLLLVSLALTGKQRTGASQGA